MDIPLPLAPEEGYILNSMKHANALTKQRLENLYYGPEKEANIGYTTANTNKINTMLPLEAQELGLKNQFYAPNIQSEIAGRNALTNRYNTMTPLEAQELALKNKFYPKLTEAQITNYNMGGRSGMGVGAKEHIQAQSFVGQDNPNFTPEQRFEAVGNLLQGKNTLEDGTPIKVGGLTNSALDQIYRRGTTAGLITKGVQANAGEAELKVLNKYASDGMKLAGTTYFGKSPTIIASQFSNKDSDQEKLGKIIGGNALQYAIAQIRNRIDMGEPGITATHEIMQNSGQVLNALPGLIKLTPKARESAMKIISTATSEALEARNKYGISARSAVNLNNQSNNQSPQGMVKMNDPNGVPHYVPQANVQMAMQKYNFTMGQ